MRSLIIAHNDKLLKHDFGLGHPLRSERLRRYFELLEEKGLLKLPNVKVLKTDATVDDEDILAVHDESLLSLIKRLSLKGGLLDADTPVPIGTYEMAKLQAGCFLEAALKVLSGEANAMVQCVAFGGHHATKEHVGFSFGFCYFNQDAIVVRCLQRKGYVKRAVILDCDAHHGNGIQEIFYEDPTVLYVSIHQDPRTLYPGTGFVEEVGAGEGEGYNVNIPLPPRTSDEGYLTAFNEIVRPIVEQFKPDVLLWIFGADTYFADPLANLNLTMKGYAAMADVVTSMAERACEGKLLSVLGGGYDLRASTLAFCLVTAKLADVSVDISDPYDPPAKNEYVKRKVEDVIRRVKNFQGRYWKI